MSLTKIKTVFGDHPNIGFVSIFYSLMDAPLGIWKKQERQGHIKRAVDVDTYPALQLTTASNIYYTYITTPSPPFTGLGITLPHLVIILKNMGKSFAFVVQIRDQFCKRRFIFSTCYGTQRIKHLCSHVPISLQKDWNELAIDLETLTRKAYGTTYQETVRVQIHANCCLRMMYFSEVPSATAQAVEMMKVILHHSSTSSSRISNSSQSEATLDFNVLDAISLYTNTCIEKNLTWRERLENFKIKSAISGTNVQVSLNETLDSASLVESKSCPKLEYDGKLDMQKLIEEELTSSDFEKFIEHEKLSILNAANGTESNYNLAAAISVSIVDEATKLFLHEPDPRQITYVPDNMNRVGQTLISGDKMSQTDLNENKQEMQTMLTHNDNESSFLEADDPIKEVDNQIAEIQLILQKMMTHRARCVVQRSVSLVCIPPSSKSLVNEMKLKIEQMKQRLTQLEAAFEDTQHVPSGAIQIVSNPMLTPASSLPGILRFPQTTSSVGKLKQKLSVSFAPILEEEEPEAENQSFPFASIFKKKSEESQAIPKAMLDNSNSLPASETLLI